MSGAIALLLVAALIVANGLFVAAEFALVSLRRPTVEALADGGDRRARSVTRELSRISFALSAAQFGITATSLLVGYLAERAIGDTLIRPVLELLGLPGQAALGFAITGAFLTSTILQMVLGELFPKNLAISRPVGVALAVVPFTRGFGLAFGPLIRVFHGAAEMLTERVLRVEVAEELEAGHDLGELARIIAASGDDGSLTSQQTALLRRATALGDRRAGEVMVPRPDVVWLTAEDTLADLRELARRTGHSRFPLRGEHEDEVLGSVHVKDLLSVPEAEHVTTSVRDVATPIPVVPETEPLRRLLSELRRARRTSALVVDEYGGTAGLVTLEDVLEELVGDIEDEFDREGHLVRRVGAGRYLVRGSLRADRIEQHFGEPLPEGAYETVAGFMLDRLGHIPEPGEVVVHGPLELTVAAVRGVRITEVAVRRVEEHPGLGAGPADDDRGGRW